MRITLEGNRAFDAPLQALLAGAVLTVGNRPPPPRRQNPAKRQSVWRRLSVIRDHGGATVAGQGGDGYRAALERSRAELA